MEPQHQTKFFVPRYRHTAPPRNPSVQLMNAMFVKVDEADLPRIVEHWRQMDSGQWFSNLGEWFGKSARKICALPSEKHVIEPYLRRPHITIHGGSKPGKPEFREEFIAVTREMGRLVAINGFNLWTGGGGVDRGPIGTITSGEIIDNGLMSAMTTGFYQGIEEMGGPLPDQYCVHFIPAAFAFPLQNRIGLRPANEGLSHAADIVVIMPDFFTRREMLDGRCAAALTGLGGGGTLDEFTDIVTVNKTGQAEIPLYLLNLWIEARKKHFYSNLLAQFQDNIDMGMDNPEIFRCFNVVTTPQKAFDHLIPHLEEKGKLPKQVYDRYCSLIGTEDNPVMPGIPRSRGDMAKLADLII